MPIFEIEHDGKTFEVEAPDMDAALSGFQKSIGGSSKSTEDKSYKGILLPISRDANGEVRFDSDAGILGAIKRTITLPREVYDGTVDLNTDEGLERTLEAAATITPLGPATRIPGGATSLVKKAPQKVEPPTAEALRAAADEGYHAARNQGVEFSSDAVRNLAGSIRAGLEKDGVIEELAPNAFSVLKKLESPPEGSTAPFEGLVAARRAFGEVRKNFNNPTDQLAAGRAQRRLDTFLEGSDPSSVVAGSAPDAARLYRDANGNYAAAARSDKLNGIEEAAELRAAAANSGRNGDNAIRQRVASLLTNPRQRVGFSEEELAQLEKVVRGSRAGNTVRAVGNMLGGGGGLGSTLLSLAGGATGAFAGSPGMAAAGVALPLVGMGAKKYGQALTEMAFGKADAMTRMRSPLYEQMLREAPMEARMPVGREAVVRALLTAQGIQLNE